MIFLIIPLALVLIFMLVVYYFFSIAFVKHNIGDADNLDDPLNIPLQKYRNEIASGLEYIKTKPHKWVYTTSFDGLKLVARYFDNGSKKTVILFHGYRSSAARDFSCAVKMYTSFGFNVLLCDQRSHGRSDGRLITFGVKESRDVKTWVEYAVYKFGAEEILLGGMSMGATTVLLSLGEDLLPNVKAVIADCGFTSPVDIIKKVARQAFKINATPILPFINFYCLIFGNFSIFKISTADVLKKSKVPVLFVHGKKDGFVPKEMSEAGFAAANRNSRILLVDDADHGLSYLVDSKRVEEEVKSFLDSTF